MSIDAYAMREQQGESYADVHSRPEDIAWAKRKIRWLFAQAGVPMLAIRVES